jgi:hypothetical protein
MPSRRDTYMRPILKYSIAVALSAAVLAAAVAFLLFPHTNPSVIHLKTKVLGPRLTYAPLAYDSARWEVVLEGVRSADVRWLEVAADLRSALDTHPGEEMLSAVSSVLELNPHDAIQLLIPSYGADLVCAQDEDGGPVSAAVAKRRVRLLEDRVASPTARQCLAAVKRILGSEEAG